MLLILYSEAHMLRHALSYHWAETLTGNGASEQLGSTQASSPWFCHDA